MKKIFLSAQLQAFLANKKLLAGLLGFVIAVSAVSSYFFFNQLKQPVAEATVAQADAQLEELELGEEPEDLSQLNILLLGYGGAGHQGGFLTDAIQILHLDFDQGKVGLISIPRDLWVALPNGKQAKINQALSLADDSSQLVTSGSQVAMQMAQVVTGLKLHYFIATDFVGLKRTIGTTLGSITVNVPEALDDPWYPLEGEQLNPCEYSAQEIAELSQQYSGFELEKKFECRYEHIQFDVGLNKMEGSDALAYIRSRHGSAGGDFSRSQRQHALLKGIKDKLLSLDVLRDIPQFYQAVSSNITTDLDLEMVQYLAPALKNAFEYQVKEVVISTENVLENGKSSDGQYIVVPRAGSNQWGGVQQFVQEELK